MTKAPLISDWIPYNHFAGPSFHKVMKVLHKLNVARSKYIPTFIGSYRRVGNSIEIAAKFTTPGPHFAQVLLPRGFQIDYNKIGPNQQNCVVIGDLVSATFPIV